MGYTDARGCEIIQRALEGADGPGPGPQPPAQSRLAHVQAFEPDYGIATLSNVDSGKVSSPLDVPTPIEPYYRSWDDRFSFAQHFPVSHTDFARDFDNHIIILAVTRGWAFARERFLLDQQWDAIEASDAELTRHHCLSERFAFLWILRSNLKAISLAHTKNEGERRFQQYLGSINDWGNARPPLVPPWLAPCHAQHATAHSRLIDYIPWPTLRCRMTASQELYCTDRFMKPYVKYIRFRWPRSWQAAITLHHSGGMLEFSDEFQARMMDIACWAFDLDFVSQFPEIASDVAVYDPNPVHVLIPSTERMHDSLVDAQCCAHEQSNKSSLTITKTCRGCAWGPLAQQSLDG